MSRWHNVRLRADLFRALQAQASAQSRSVAGQLDFIVTAALEQEPNTSASSGGGPPSGVIPGESGRGAGVDLPGARGADGPRSSRVDPASAPARAPIEGQTTVEEMLASCPNCAEALVEEQGVVFCSAGCGYTRED
jgi:hypothetical protein